MRVLLSGSSGLVGRALSDLLASHQDEVVRLVRRPARTADEISWSPEDGRLDVEGVGPVEAVVHLAGESIAGAPRWTRRHKEGILQSRLNGTRTIAGFLACSGQKPSVLISASAAGFYGDCGEGEVDETGATGDGFLAEVCRAWEGATAAAEEAGIRVVHLRIGLVLSSRGGALAAMLPLFRMGLGGRLGSGRQWVSWISLPDLVRAAVFAIRRPDLRGAVNAVAPAPIRNEELTRTLGRVLGRPAALGVPAFALRLLMGEMADEMLLGGARIVPRCLLEAGFEFRTPDFEAALRGALQGGT